MNKSEAAMQAIVRMPMTEYDLHEASLTPNHTATMKHTYCNPQNAGLASEPQAVRKRLGKLLDALADHINSNIAQGQGPGTISYDLLNFRYELIQKLKADGYEVSCPGNNMRVRESQA